MKKLTTNNNIAYLYKYWRFRLLYSMFIGYIFFYFSRKSLILLSPLIIEDLKISLYQIGIINSIFYITYAASKFIGGIITDKSNPRYIMSIGLMFTGLFNLLIGMSNNIIIITILWTLNAFFQGWGWPPITKQLTYWYNKTDRGFWWGIFSISHNVGGAIIPIIIGFSSIFFFWQVNFYIIGLSCIIISLLLLNRLRNTPESLGLPPIDSVRINHNIINQSILNIILFNKNIWLLCFCYFFIYIIKTGLNDWIILYLINQKEYTLLSAGICVFNFEIGGMLGIILTGWLSCKFVNNRIVFLLIYIKLLLIISIIFYTIPIGYNKIDCIIIFALGFVAFAPQILIGLTASELVDKNIACTANSFVGSWAYIGAALAGYPFSFIINLSWNFYFIIIVLCELILIIIIIIILNKNKI